ncbi:type II toxin-antitoxin system RelE/ParE family toxin [Candidatus Peregrinibacteria bacterium]|jgi:mRNA interferase RelE/StbE|nr:type II toxin-antitoxin system RelE/ParE family toxin [Candidatus Peregrinibacteria bacterium]
MYDVIFSKRADKDIKKIPRNIKLDIVERCFEVLSHNPYPHSSGNPKKLKGTSIFRLRIGDYRILYEVEGARVEVYKIQLRKDVYKKLGPKRF